MGFVKVIKNKAYFSRFQVKFRRRRECKTDYYARRRLLIQDKNKYASPKYRFVVRFSNREVITQIVSSDLDHDVVIAAAYSHELRRYGITVGLNNWAAAYCTGLLLARRVNAKFNLDFEGAEEIDGEEFLVEEPEEGARPFKALLDVGLARTTTGAKLFGALKGACDGGLNIPHKARRFPGSTATEGSNWEPNAEVTRNYIFGQHVADYMRHLSENDQDAYKRQFSAYIAAGVSADDLEGLYTAAHAAIRADPNKARDPSELGSFKTRSGKKATEFPKKQWKDLKRSNAQRQGRITQILTARGVAHAEKVRLRDTPY